MLRYLETHSEVLLTSSTIPDYSPDAPGWKTGRCLLTADYDGEKLGADFALLRPPIPELGLFHSMQVSPPDAYRLPHCHSSIGEAVWTLKRVGRYFLLRLGVSRGTPHAPAKHHPGRLL